MLQAFKNGHELLQSVKDLDFDFSQEKSDSGLPLELGALFEQSGKRFRPALCFLFGQAVGIDAKTLAPYARAVEMTHTASLVHDDVIDEAAERRQFPTLNHRYGNTSAVLAGDFLLAKVIGDIAAIAPTEILVGLTDAIKELADGEWLQHQLKVRFAAKLTELETVARKKTGALMAWACATPVTLAKLDKEMVQDCYRLGEDVGVFFQMLDDVNDFNPRSGKPFAQDLRVGQLNFVTARLVEMRPEIAGRLVDFRQNDQAITATDWSPAIHDIHERTLKLESDLVARFAQIFPQAKVEAEVFAKMLVKVREGFLPQGI